MPKQIEIANRYRRAECCATCRYERQSTCSITCLRINPGYVCDRHETDYARDARAIKCCHCKFGGNGDRSCSFGGALKSGFRGCFLGKRIPGTDEKREIRTRYDSNKDGARNG